MDLIPEKIYRGKNSNGETFKVNEWRPDSVGNVNAPADLGTYLMLILFTCIASPLTLAITLFNKSHVINLLNVIGWVLGCYFLYDVYHGWLLSRFIMLFLSDEVMMILVAINCGTVIGNFVKFGLNIILNSEFISPIVIIFIGAITYVGSIINYDLSKIDHSYLDRNIQTETSVYDPSPNDHIRLDGSKIN